MTGQEWLASTEPEVMFACPDHAGLASERKGLLFALACLRRVWPGLNERSRDAVEVLERSAARLPADEEREAARRAAERGAQAAVSAGADYYNTDFYGYDPSEANAFIDLADAVRTATAAGVTDAQHVAHCAAGAASYLGAAGVAKGWSAERAAQAALLRDIFGPLPFRPVTTSPTWSMPQVVALAQAAYDQRDLPCGTLDVARLAVLADALEDAGCDRADLPAHLRGPGPHVRGCWAIDLLLGKQ
jgi:hypothetical protein